MGFVSLLTFIETWKPFAFLSPICLLPERQRNSLLHCISQQLYSIEDLHLIPLKSTDLQQRSFFPDVC